MRAKWSRAQLLVCSGLLIASAIFAQSNPLSPVGFRRDRILVKPNSGVDLSPVHVALGTRVLRDFPMIGGLQVLQLPAGAPVADIIAAYQNTGLVAYAEPDYEMRALAAPNDPRYWDGSLWGLNNSGQLNGRLDADIDAPEGWEAQNSAAGIVVAVIDTGVRYTHEDLAANMWINPGETGSDFLGRDKSANVLDDDGNGYIDDVHGIDAILGTGYPLDDHGHGTHVAGTIGGAGNNSVGIAGVAWRAQLMACKFLNALGQGNISDAIDCINYARSKGAKVINASWGGYGFGSNALRDAIDSARSAGIIFVAAAGNDNNNNDVNPLYPAAYDLDNVIAVAATDRADNRASFSNFGATTVDIGAPGQDIFSCGNGNDGDYRNLSGTSMAAPHVVGVCALTWARYSGETYRQIINRVLNGVDPLPALAGKTVTGGRLNLQKALGTTPSALPVVTVVVSDSSAAEAGSDSGTFVVTRTGGTTSALTVNYSMGGNAANGTDYNPLQTSVTIPAGAASATVTVTPADDSAVEGAETAILTILAHAAYAVGSPNSATITLSDNDALVAFPFGVSPASGLASKGARGGSFTPDSQIYVLTNSSDVPLGWAVTKDRTWVSLSATNGTLAPFSGATVTASINAQANQLAPGTYNAHIRFLNTSTSVGDTTRKATLKIHRPSTLSSVVYNVVNGPLLGLEEFRFRVFGDPGQIHIIQASTNLVDWATLLTNTMPPVGYFDFKDNQVGRVQRCFYRTISKAGDPVVLGDGVFRGDRILVKPLPGVDLSLLYRLLGLQVLQSFPAIGNLQIIQLPGGGIVENILAVLRQSGLVEYAEPDFQVQALVEPNDFRFVDGSLWNLRNVGQNGGQADADIDAPEGWEAQNAADNIIVAVIDTGVRYTHEDLAANIWVNSAETAGNNLDDDGNGYVDDVHGIDAINNSGDPNDVHGHGTHVSGVVGAVGNNTVGVVGVAWRVKIIGCRFLDPTGNGFIADAIKCIDYSRSKGAKIINTSWGSTTFNSAALRDAFDSARQAGIIVTAAAGNAADNNDVNPLYPASYDLDNIVSVAATTRNDELASFSSYGATSVDLAAPGAAIFSCWNGSDSDYRYFDGTSMSAPHVTGVSALLWAHYPAENYQQIINRVLSNVDPLPSLAGKCVSGGRLNLQRALGISPPPPDEPVFTLSEFDPAASETGLDKGVIRFHRTGDTTQPIQLSWTFSGTAVNGSDFEQLPTSGPFPAGLSEADLTISPFDDEAIEGNETVIVTLVDGPGYRVGSPSSATVTLADNDQGPPPNPTVTIEATDAEASEPNNTGTFTVSRTGDSSAALTVGYFLDGTAQHGTDYQQLETSVTIPAGSSSATVIVTPIDDTTVESSETVVLTLSSDAAYDIGSPSSATVTLADNDQPPPPNPTVTVAASDANAAEPNNTGAFTVARTGSTSSALTVNYTVNGSASSGSDYQSLGSSVTIPAGSSSATVTVTPIDDTTVESSETVVLTLSSDSAYDIGSPSSATVTIGDNDQPPPPRVLRLYLHGDDIPGTAGGFTMNETPAPSQTVSLNLLNSPSWFSDPALTGSFQEGATFTLVIPRTLGLSLAMTFRLAATDAEGNGEQLLGQTTQVLGLGLGPHTISIPVTAPVTLDNQRLKLTISTAVSLNANLQLGSSTFLEATEFVSTP